MIIAEVGQNHCGDMKLAEKLIDLAKENGADKVKFQLYDSKVLYGEKQKSELNKGQAYAAFNYGREIGIEVFFSVFDVERIEWCEWMGVETYKLSCGFVHPKSGHNMDVADAILKTKKPTIVSYSRWPVYSWARPNKLSALYCIPEYPASINFKGVSFQRFDGFSDHTVGLDAAKIAIAKGAKIIEKHFAIDHTTGVDAPWSMTPKELKELKRWEDVVKGAL